MTREEAIEWLQSRKEHWEMDDDGQELAQALEMGIQALENQKTGHWIDCADKDLWYRCSECGKRMWSGNCYNYCSNCGAKMIETQKSEG